MAEMRGMLLLLLYVSHSSSTDCGIQKTNTMDGEAKENLVSSAEFPWVVSVQDMQYTHLVFGCILSEFWTLSIASALQNRKDIIIVVGIANMDPTKNAYKEYPVSTIILHEDFDNYSMSNDIALLKTESEIQFDDLVHSICFLDKKLTVSPTVKNCWVSGWNPTSATGNHMTMSILRRISVEEVRLCPLHKLRKAGCGSHTEQDTSTVCLGEPGSPMMCQLQKLDLWVLRGIVTQGGDTCPGLFLFTKVEDYSDWIVFNAKIAGPPLSSLQPWEKVVPVSYFEPHTVTESEYSEVDHTEWPQSNNSQGPEKSTEHSQLAQGSKTHQDFRLKSLQESDRPEVASQPMYYDYYGGEVAAEGRVAAGQDRLHRPQEQILVSLMLVFLSSGV